MEKTKHTDKYASNKDIYAAHGETKFNFSALPESPSTKQNILKG